jgi:hypothetical protein
MSVNQGSPDFDLIMHQVPKASHPPVFLNHDALSTKVESADADVAGTHTSPIGTTTTSVMDENVDVFVDNNDGNANTGNRPIEDYEQVDVDDRNTSITESSFKGNDTTKKLKLSHPNTFHVNVTTSSIGIGTSSNIVAPSFSAAAAATADTIFSGSSSSSSNSPQRSHVKADTTTKSKTSTRKLLILETRQQQQHHQSTSSSDTCHQQQQPPSSPSLNPPHLPKTHSTTILPYTPFPFFPSTSSSSKLPPEILNRIFENLRPLQSPPPSPSPSPPASSAPSPTSNSPVPSTTASSSSTSASRQNLLECAHVCRNWTQSALEVLYRVPFGYDDTNTTNPSSNSISALQESGTGLCSSLTFTKRFEKLTECLARNPRNGIWIRRLNLNEGEPHFTILVIFIMTTLF